ncbi:hypothetical protein IAU60_003664 [Kwoniella sp. DSM 27419]
MVSPPTPFHLLRVHHAPLSALSFNASNTLLYSGDQDGYVAILDLRVRRVICYWKAHDGGVLGLEEWEGGLLSHGRDNVIHLYEPLKKPYISFGIGGGQKPGPAMTKSLPVNALNFCRFSLLPIPAKGAECDESNENDQQGPSDRGYKGKQREREAILAVPSLMDSELVDLYHLPSLRRLHASVNYLPKITSAKEGSPSAQATRSGLVMSLHLRARPGIGRLTLSIGYEDGRVELFRSTLASLTEPYDSKLSRRENPWQLAWSFNGHNEAVMGMDVDKTGRYGWTVSADHRLVRYDFGMVLDSQDTVSGHAAMKDYSIKSIGHSSVITSPSGRVVATGGWDGKIRLFSAETFKTLGTLSSHRDNVHVLAFASGLLDEALLSGDRREDTEASSTLDLNAEDSDEEDMEDDLTGVPPRHRWLASGGKDTKVALWGLMDFGD